MSEKSNEDPTGTETLEIHEGDKFLELLDFKPFRNSAIRSAVQFLPGPGEPDTEQILSPWGEYLTAKPGDYIVCEYNTPEDRWPVSRELFEETYVEFSPGLYQKRQITFLIPLERITRDSDQIVSVFTREGVVNVRAGDFCLARGLHGEIWPIPNDKVKLYMTQIED